MKFPFSMWKTLHSRIFEKCDKSQHVKKTCQFFKYSNKKVCRRLSSSLITSSSRMTGYSPQTSLIRYASASFRESALLRCCPREP